MCVCQVKKMLKLTRLSRLGLRFQESPPDFQISKMPCPVLGGRGSLEYFLDDAKGSALHVERGRCFAICQVFLLGQLQTTQ